MKDYFSKRFFAQVELFMWVIAANRITLTIRHSIRAILNPWRRDAYKVHIPSAVAHSHKDNSRFLLQTRAEQAGDKVRKLTVRCYEDYHANKGDYRYEMQCTCGHVDTFNFNGYQETNYEFSRDEARRAAKAAMSAHRTTHRFIEIGYVSL